MSDPCPLSLAALLQAERVVGYRPCFAAVFGGATCAVLLSQFWYWTGTPTVRARGGWFWKTQREITEETGLTRRETETARRRLCALGVLQEQRRSVPARLYFRLDVEMLARLLAEQGDQARDESGFQFAQKRQTSMAGSARLDCTNPPNKCSRNRQTTSESTAERTQISEQPVLPAALRIPEKQQAVNRQGAARFKAALDAAAGRRTPEPTPGGKPPTPP